MLIGNPTKHVGVGSSYAIKILLQYKSKTKKVPFLFQILFAL